MDGWMEGQREGGTDGRTNRQTDRQIDSIALVRGPYRPYRPITRCYKQRKHSDMLLAFHPTISNKNEADYLCKGGKDKSSEVAMDDSCNTIGSGSQTSPLPGFGSLGDWHFTHGP